MPVSSQSPVAIIGAANTVFSAAGRSLVLHEWTDTGPSYLHRHRSDDEAWHVLEGCLRFRFSDRQVDAQAGTTVFVPAGVAHAYSTVGPSRYLMFLTPRMDRLIARLRNLPDRSALRATLAEFDTELLEHP